jgi:asparagine synthase (glutamine-hydrolysing)
MWAFAIWDGRNNKLFLSRDRFGVKPLYYYCKNNVFAFSSEIKPLLLAVNEKAEIREDKIPFFILYGNRLNTEDTYLKNIYSLQHSHYLVFSGGNISVKKYYDIPVKSLPSDEKALKENLTELFTDSIKLRFRSDVKVGTCLSGGFDSSSIVAFSNIVDQKGIETFSAVWSDPACDETKYIDLVNERFGSHANKIEPKEYDFADVFKRIHYYQEIPTEGPGLYPQWHVMKKAAGKVKVLLDGQGGDEVFGGYYQLGVYLRSLIRDKKTAGIFKDVFSYISFLNNKGIHSFSSWIFPGFYNKFVRANLSEQFKIFNPALVSDISKQQLYYDIEPPKKFGNYLNNLSYHFINNLTIPTLLHYEDRSSMAFSIESRVPFLDYRLVEFGVNLAPKHLVYKSTTRPLYRKAIEPYLPGEIVNRKDKLGYPVPFNEWTRNSLKSYVSGILFSQDALIYNYLDISRIKNNLNRHFKKEIDYGWEIWRLLSLEEILNVYKHQADLKFELREN